MGIKIPGGGLIVVGAVVVVPGIKITETINIIYMS